MLRIRRQFLRASSLLTACQPPRNEQAVGPTVISHTFEAIETADFLSPAQKRDILCANAPGFFASSLRLATYEVCIMSEPLQEGKKKRTR